MVREGRVFISALGTGKPAFGSNYYVQALEVGAQVTAGSSGTTVTVAAGHGFAAGDKYMKSLDAATYSGVSTVASVTSTTLTLDSALTVSDGDVLINLGADTGSTTPNYDGNGVVIYSDMDYSTSVTNATVTADSNGRYIYYYKGIARWELVRTGTTLTALYQDTTPAASSIINVRDYGAVGNGTTDDVYAIQSALNAVASTGGKVYVPAGTYIVSTALWVKSYTHLCGDGMDATTIKRKASSLVATAAGTAGTNKVIVCGSAVGTVYTNASPGYGITISDLTVDGNYSNNSIAAGYGADGISTGQTTSADTGGCIDGFTVQRVKAINLNNDGIRVRNSRNVLIDSCVIKTTGQIAAADSKNSITLTGGPSEIANGWNTNAVISNNRISYSGDATYRAAEGVAMLLWSNVVVCGNDISHVDYAIENTYTSGSYTTYNHSITGNTIHDLTEATTIQQVGIVYGNVTASPHKGLTISGNSFYNIYNNGIYLGYVDSPEIVGNMFRVTNTDTTQATYAVCVQTVDCNNINISSNLIKMDSAHAGTYGIKVQGFGGAVTDGIISSNTIINPPQGGILITGGVSRMLVSGNRILGSVTSISINNSGTNASNFVSDNYVTGYSSAGVSDTSGQTNYIVDYDQSPATPIMHVQNQVLQVSGADYVNSLTLKGTTSTSVRSPRVAFIDNQASAKTMWMSKDQSNSQDCVAVTGTGGSHVMALMDSGALRLIEQASTPGSPTNQTMCNMYMKGDKLIIEFRDGASAGHWFSLDLTATSSQSWVYAAAAP